MVYKHAVSDNVTNMQLHCCILGVTSITSYDVTILNMVTFLCSFEK